MDGQNKIVQVEKVNTKRGEKLLKFQLVWKFLTIYTRRSWRDSQLVRWGSQLVASLDCYTENAGSSDMTKMMQKSFAKCLKSFKLREHRVAAHWVLKWTIPSSLWRYGQLPSERQHRQGPLRHRLPCLLVSGTRPYDVTDVGRSRRPSRQAAEE